MRKDLIFYGVAAIIAILAFSATLFLPIPDLYRGTFTVPGILALLGIATEAWRDKRAHENALDLLTRQQDNSLAVASHMATVVFDRQVKFCEEYFEKVHSILQDLFSTGPTTAALDQAGELSRIRIHYSPWLSPQIEAGLLPFERALREVGVDARLIDLNLPKQER